MAAPPPHIHIARAPQEDFSPGHRARPMPSFSGPCASLTAGTCASFCFFFPAATTAAVLLQKQKKERWPHPILIYGPVSCPTLSPLQIPSFRVPQSFMTDAWHVPLLPPPQGDWSITFRNGDQGRTQGNGGAKAGLAEGFLGERKRKKRKRAWPISQRRMRTKPTSSFTNHNPHAYHGRSNIFRPPRPPSLPLSPTPPTNLIYDRTIMHVVDELTTQESFFSEECELFAPGSAPGRKNRTTPEPYPRPRSQRKRGVVFLLWPGQRCRPPE